MLKIFKIVMTFAAVALSTACSLKCEDAMSFNGTDEVIIDFGEVRTASGERYIVRDDGIVLHIESNIMENDMLRSGDRILANYVIIDDRMDGFLIDAPKGGYDIRFNNAIVIPCKGVLKRSDMDAGKLGSLKYDPVSVKNVHIGARHIDLQVDYYCSDNVVHTFDLLCEESADDSSLVLYLAHDAGSDLSAGSAASLARGVRLSFDVAAIQTGSRQKMKLVWTNIDGLQNFAAGELGAAVD